MDLNPISSDDDKRRMQELLISAGAIGAGFLLKRLMEHTYKNMYHEEAPDKIDNRDINWGKLAGWTIVSGVAVTGLKVLIKRYAGKMMDEK